MVLIVLQLIPLVLYPNSSRQDTTTMAIKDRNVDTAVPADSGVTAYEAEVIRTTSRASDFIAPTDPKVEMGHVEAQTQREFDRTSTVNDTEKLKVPISPESYYRDFSPIAELNLENWQATEKSLVRRLDLTLLPTLWILYLNNYLDRTNIAQARLNGMDRDIGLTGDDYNLAVSILTIGYMLAQLPSNMLLTRVRPSIYLPVTCIVWSSVAIATAGVKNAQHLFVVRFFLGILEAPLFPGVSHSIIPK